MIQSPSLVEIFTTFTKVALGGFGGVLPVSRFTLVDKKKWLTEKDFAEQLAIAQLLPGPNIVNLSVGLGDRFHGIAGSAAAVAGLMTVPFMLFMVLAWGYHYFSDSIIFKAALLGVSAAAAGLIVSTGLKLVKTMPKKVWAFGIGITTFCAIAVAHLTLYQVVFSLGIAGVALAYWLEKP